MSRLNYDVAELVLKKLGELESATTTWAGVSEETARALRENAGLWRSTFEFCALPLKLQSRLVDQSKHGCLDRTYRMLLCVSKKFSHISFWGLDDEGWHWAFMLKNYKDPHSPAPSPPSRSSSEGSSSNVWTPVSPSGESSSGSDDEDLLEKFKAMEAGMDTAK
jgi:hypothetical protein